MRALNGDGQVLTGHMKGLVKLFDVGRPSDESMSCNLRYKGKKKKLPLSSLRDIPFASNSSDSNTIAVGAFTGDNVYIIDKRTF